ncbi:MAG: HlyD family efflux transporter periplasmic adaptor subunit [Thermoflexus sp.]|uniref:HlyD family secretion protein n=1 Tax=Thermoflexus sp. TaxID=1969742 RepID=UPI0025DF44C5|nr:HlyD family efflux transporter periplasmic adaptor subunit [Thermoflexus sp.]MCS6963263.1 HlyD family efflux transporter periplasmic adaptor subunit [Thermoflexus sp.]
MRKPLRAGILVIAIGGIAALAGAWWLSRPAASGFRGSMMFSGTLTGRRVQLSAEVSGIVRWLAEEGTTVRSGERVAELEDPVLSQQLMEAEAALAAAQAEAAALEAGMSPEQQAVLAAQVRQAAAEVEAAERRYQALLRQLREPQDLERQILEAQTALAMAEQGVERARAELEKARADRDRLPFGQREIADRQVAAAEAAWRAAEAERDAARARLEGLIAMRQRPLALLAQVHAAEAQIQAAEAALRAPQARLDRARNGPTLWERNQARAAVALAEARRDLLRLQVERLRLTAPFTATVSERLAHEGETVRAGQPVLSLSAVDPLEATIFVPVSLLGRLRVGQPAVVQVDAFPGEQFPGVIARIAPEATFTPRNVQTREERQVLVFAVTVRVPNPEGRLKIGMPADVQILP